MSETSVAIKREFDAPMVFPHRLGLGISSKETAVKPHASSAEGDLDHQEQKRNKAEGLHTCESTNVGDDSWILPRAMW